MIGPALFGSTCRTRARMLDAPDACAASTYSRERKDMTEARTTRATPVHSTALSHSPSLNGVAGCFDQMSTITSTAIAGIDTAMPDAHVTTSVKPAPVVARERADRHADNGRRRRTHQR